MMGGFCIDIHIGEDARLTSAKLKLDRRPWLRTTMAYKIAKIKMHTTFSTDFFVPIINVNDSENCGTNETQCL